VHSETPFDHKRFTEHPFTFCEFNCLGLYAWHFEKDLYEFELPSPRIKEVAQQLWSWGVEPGKLDELERQFPG
jgi:hypothetical protein